MADDVPPAPRAAADGVVFGFAARAETIKGVSELMEAFGLARGRAGGIELSVASARSKMGEMIERAASLGAGDSFRHAGVYEDPEGRARFLGGVDVLVLPSHTEGTPNGIVEAMSQGVPVIASAAELDRLLPLNCGIRTMTARPDPAAFARALAGEIERYDPADAERASRRVREACGRDRAADEFISIYEGVIDESSGAPAHDCREEGLAAADYLRELLQSIKDERRALRASNTFRLKERLRRAPLAGRLSLMIARRLAGKPAKDG